MNFAESTARPVVARVTDVSEGIIHPLDVQLCQIVGATLCRHYSGWEWRVEVDHAKGLIDIRNQTLSGSMGMRLKMSGHATASELEDIAMRAGGEILERYNMPRGICDEERVDASPVNGVGDIIFST